MKTETALGFSTNSQQLLGTIGPRPALLRSGSGPFRRFGARVATEGDELIAALCEEGAFRCWTGRGQDSLRDNSGVGLIDRVWCLSPDRLARVHALRVICSRTGPASNTGRVRRHTRHGAL